eukprot:scaffold4887_cov118-Cylindrotheca_fusiformis.AAC.3
MSTTTTTSLCQAWTAEWIDLKPQVAIQPPRSGHVAFDWKDEVYVFGGYAEEEDGGSDGKPTRYPTNDMWKFNPETVRWQQVHKADLHVEDCEECNEFAKKIPQQRLAAAAACLDGSAYLFGGWDPQTPGTGGVILDSISEFSLNESDDAVGGGWKGASLNHVTLGEMTSRHVAVTIDDDTILLHNHRCTDHVLLFQQPKETGKTSVQRQATTGTSPSPRGLHAASKFGENHLIVFGGAAQDQSMSNQVFALDLTTWTWKELSPSPSSSKLPSPRASPCLCPLDATSGIVFGGATPSEKGGLVGLNDLWLMSIDLENGTVQWDELPVDNAPPGRNAATLTSISKIKIGDSVESSDDNSDLHYFLLSGGWYPFVTTHGDTFVLKVAKR